MRAKMFGRSSLLAGAVALGLGLGLPSAPARAAAPATPAPVAQPAPLSEKHAAKLKETTAKAVKYLLAGQKENGSWGEPGFSNPATSGLVLCGLLQSGEVDGNHAAVKKGLTYLLTFRQKDGGFYDKALHNYNTAVCLMAFHAAAAAEHKDLIAAAQAFLVKGQFGSDENVDELADPKSAAKKDKNYGGFGYGGMGPRGPGKPDTSNTAFVADALAMSGLPKDHAVWKRMQTFLSRAQLRSESNDQPYAKDLADDGGFIYELEGGGMKYTDPKTGKELLRSYGSMTYAGLKSFLYAGLSKDDPRVKSAYAWICRQYTLDENPYQKQAGLFYYYGVFAKGLRVWGEPTVKDPRTGVVHNWREELVDKLAAIQKDDGSWVNTDRRWMESDPRLATAFSLLALAEVRK